MVRTASLPWAAPGSWVGLVVQSLYSLSFGLCQYHLFLRLFELVVQRFRVVGSAAVVVVVAAAAG